MFEVNIKVDPQNSSDMQRALEFILNQPCMSRFKETYYNKSSYLTGNLDKQQNNFLESTLGQVIDSSVDLGLRAILPNFIEDEVIEIKDTLIKEGFPEAVNKAIDSAIDIGKSALGIVTGKFESVSQAEKAVEKGGMYFTMS